MAAALDRAVAVFFVGVLLALGGVLALVAGPGL